MAQIVIDGIDETTLGRLQVLASAAGRSPEDLARDILASATRTNPADRLARVDRIRALGPKHPGTDSWELIRKDRDNR